MASPDEIRSIPASSPPLGEHHLAIPSQNVSEVVQRIENVVELSIEQIKELFQGPSLDLQEIEAVDMKDSNLDPLVNLSSDIKESGLGDTVALFRSIVSGSGVLDDSLILQEMNNALSSFRIVDVTHHAANLGYTFLQNRLVNVLEDVLDSKDEMLKQLESGDSEFLEQDVEDVRARIVVLKKAIKVIKLKLNKSRSNNLIELSLKAPELTGLILRCFSVSAKVIEKTVALYASGIGVVCAGLALKGASENKKSYEGLVKLVDGLTTRGGNLKKAEEIRDVLSKQPDFREFFENRLLLALSEEGKKDKIIGILKDWQNAGVEIPKEFIDKIKEADDEKLPGAVGKLIYYLKSQKLSIREKQETINVSVHNALTACAQHKIKIDKGFLDFRLRKAKFTFGASGVFAALVIVKEVLVGAVITGFTAALSMTAIGAMVVAIGTLVVGATYFYIKKPNMFKAYLKLVPVRLLLKEIPFYIKKYHLTVTKLKIEKIQAKLISKKLEDKKSQKMQKSIEKMEKLQERLEKTVESRKKTIGDLRNVLWEAGRKDFVRSAGIKMKKSKDPLEHEKDPPELENVIAEYLMKSEVEKGGKMDELLQFMQVDIEELQAEKNDKELERLIKGFFGATLNETLEKTRFLEKQKGKNNEIIASDESTA